MMNRLGTRIITSTSPRTFVRTTDILCNLPPFPCTKTKTKLVNLPEESIAFCLSLCCCCCCDSPDVLWSTCPRTCPPSCPSLPRGEVAPLPPSSSSWPPGFLQKDCCTDEENRSNFHIFYSGDGTIFPTHPTTTPDTRTDTPEPYETIFFRNLHLARRDDLLRPSCGGLSFLYSDLKH